jgi:hypothetical protein
MRETRRPSGGARESSKKCATCVRFFLRVSRTLKRGVDRPGVGPAKRAFCHVGPRRPGHLRARRLASTTESRRWTFSWTRSSRRATLRPWRIWSTRWPRACPRRATPPRATPRGSRRTRCTVSFPGARTRAPTRAPRDRADPSTSTTTPPRSSPRSSRRVSRPVSTAPRVPASSASLAVPPRKTLEKRPARKSCTAPS